MSWFVTGHGGSHDLKFGGQYQYVGARSTAQDNSNGTFLFRTDQSFNASDPARIPSGCRFACPDALNRYQKAHFVAAFAQDKWHVIEPRDGQPRAALRPRSAADLRSRQSRVSGSGEVSARHEQHRAASRPDLRPQRRRPGRRPRRLRPLLRQDALRADLGDPDRRRVLRFVRRALPGQQRGPRTLERRRCRPIRCSPAARRSTARFSRRCYPPGSRVKNTGTVNLDNPDRVIPYTDQITAGYERQLWTTISVSADYVHARARDQLMLQDLNPGSSHLDGADRDARAVRSRATSGAVNQPVNAGVDRLRRARSGARQALRVRLFLPRLVHARRLAREYDRSVHSRRAASRCSTI